MSLIFLMIYLIGISLFLLCATPLKHEDYTVLRGVRHTFRIHLNTRTAILIIIITAVGFLCATRSYESYDTFVYVPWYIDIQETPLLQKNGKYGIFFELFAKIVAKVLNGNYQVFFFLVAAFNLFVVYKVITKEEKNRETALLTYSLYITFIGLYYSFIVLRQGLAFTMVIAAYCVLDRSKIKALLLCVAGALFHESAWIAVLCVLLFYNTKIKLKSVALYMLLAVSLVFYVTHSTTRFIVPILQALLNVLNKIDAFTFHKYILYFEERALTYDVSFLYLIYYLLTIGIVYYLYKGHGEESLDLKDRFFITINVMGLSMIGFFAAASAIGRLAEYLVSLTYIFLIPKCLKRITKWRDTKIIVAIIMAGMTVLHLKIILGPIDLYL